jgi:hypothetical protein
MMMRRIFFIPALFFMATCGTNKGTLATICVDDADCAVGECVEPGASAVGQCTSPCQTDDDCADRFDEGACLITCDLPCTGDAECPAATACKAGACFPTCSSDAECAEGYPCFEGFCDF